MVVDCPGENCCRVVEVLAEEDVKLIRGLFIKVGRPAPEHGVLAKLDSSRVGEYFGCPFRFEWGFDHYCNNPGRIRRFLDSGE